MSKMEQLLKQWDDLNNEVTELTCLSELIAWALYMGKDDEPVEKEYCWCSKFADQKHQQYARSLHEPSQRSSGRT